MDDISFNSEEILSGSSYSSISNGLLTIDGATVGCLSIEDGNGRLVYAPQIKNGNSVIVDLSQFNIGSSTWHVRFPRGKQGQNISGGISSNDAIIYSLLFG